VAGSGTTVVVLMVTPDWLVRNMLPVKVCVTPGLKFEALSRV